MFEKPQYMGISHGPSMNLRFVQRDGRFILQQMFVQNDWSTHNEEWRDVPLATPPDGEAEHG